MNPFGASVFAPCFSDPERDIHAVNLSVEIEQITGGRRITKIPRIPNVPASTAVAESFHMSRCLLFPGIALRIILLIFAAALLLCSCKDSPRSTEPRIIFPHTFLDDVLAEPQYAEEIKKAERDLPDDEWSNDPFRDNVSRNHREIGVAERMLAQIQPRVKKMTVTDLFKSLKVFPRAAAMSFPGVAYYLYRDGNRMIVEEIRSRPKNELGVLPGLADENWIVWDGAQGSLNSLEELIHFEILNDRR